VTFQLVAHCLNNLRHRALHYITLFVFFTADFLTMDVREPNM
jgi:hypothetical protein